MCLFLYVPGDELLERENGASDDWCCRDIKVSMCSSFCVLIHNNGSLKINYYSVIRGFHAEKLPSFLSLDVVGEKKISRWLKCRLE